jgi:glycosyltransferase involved in cell wall biosynthesis
VCPVAQRFQAPDRGSGGSDAMTMSDVAMGGSDVRAPKEGTLDREGPRTILSQARRTAKICRALLTARARRRRRSAEHDMPRVLYLLETGGPGGAERMLLDLAQHVGPRWQAVVGVLRPGWLQANAMSAGIPCATLHGKGLGDLGVFERLLEAVETHDISVLHAHEFYMGMIGAAVSLATGIPLVVTIHGKQYYPDRRRRRTMCRMVAARAAALVTVSQDLRRFFCHTTGTPSDRVRVIYNGIDLQPFESGREKAELLASTGIPTSAQILGTVGNLYPVKGHRDLIRAMRPIVERRPATHLVILGRGALHDSLLVEAETLGIRDRVHLLGYREDVHDWLAAMNVFAMPSVSEGLPLSLLEAMATGVPSVVTDVGGMPEVVADGETGFVIRQGNVAELADRISFLLEDPSRAVGMGAAGRGLVARRFALDRMVAEYSEVYDQAVDREDRAGSGRRDRYCS